MSSADANTRARIWPREGRLRRGGCLSPDIASRAGGASSSSEAGATASDGILHEDRLLEILECLVWLKAKFFDKQAASVSIGSESLGLSPRAIESQHQLAPKPLSHRMCRDERLDLADELCVAAEGQVSLDPVLERRHTGLLESRDLALRK